MSTTPEETPINLMVVNLTAAALMVVAADTAGEVARYSALSVWAMLTGLDDESAMQYAHELAEDPYPLVTASVAPF